MYDSLIYGNGLSIAIFNRLKSQGQISSVDRYLDLNIFISELVKSKPYSRIRRIFDELFDESKPEKVEIRNKALDYLKRHEKNMSYYGFERWVSKVIFDTKNEINSETKIIGYILYNLWYDTIYENIIDTKKSREVLQLLSKTILGALSSKENIYTTNFDTLIDDYLHPKHVHGKFENPFKRAGDVVWKIYNDKEFEYKFLFGTNGFEKLNRLTQINKYYSKEYDLDLFFSKEVNLGHLLIYGLSFGRAEFMSDEFYKQHPEHESLYLLKSVDGHILMNLDRLYKEKRLNEITMSYYSKDDLIHFKDMLSQTEIKDIVKFVHSDEIW